MSYAEQGVDAMAGKMLAMAEWMKRSGTMRAVRNGGKVVMEAEVERAPVQADRSLGSDSLETGELRANIRVRVKYREGVAIALIGPVGSDGRIARAAHLVEYGHRMVTGGKSRLDVDGVFRGTGKVHATDVPAHPFLRPAFEASIAAAKEAVAMQLHEELKESVNHV